MELLKKNNQDEPEKVDYYVSYNARVKAGIDFEQVKIDVNTTEDIILVSLPKIKITDIEVAMESLDFIFMDEDANTNTVSAEAYELCKNDVEDESEKEDAIYELASENAEKIIEALIEPFISQLDSTYELEISWEG